LRATPTAHRTWTPAPTPANFRKYAHRVIEGGIGHNLPQEAPQAFAQAVIDVDGF
jgi:pimeloyl-ACP methyl ester carboxylesterase